MFTLDVDNSGSPVTVDLSYLATRTTKMTGNQIAAEMTNYLNRAFGDESYFDISTATSREFTLRTSRVTTTTNGLTTPYPSFDGLECRRFWADQRHRGLVAKITTDKLEAAMQKRINNTPSFADGDFHHHFAYHAQPAPMAPLTAQPPMPTGILLRVKSRPPPCLEQPKP